MSRFRFAAWAIAALIVTGSRALVSGQGTVDFLSPGEYGSNFTTLTGGVNYSNSGGIGSSGAIQTDGSSTLFVGTSGLLNTVGQTNTVSVAFRFDASTAGADMADFIVGFSSLQNAALYSPSSNNGTRQAWLGTLSDSAHSTGTAFYAAPSNQDYFRFPATVALSFTTSHWYNASLSLTRLVGTGDEGSSYYNFSYSISDLGTSGLGAPSVLLSGSGTFGAGNTAAPDSFLTVERFYPYVAYLPNGSYSVTLDRFTTASAIPEPSTYAAIAGAAMFGLAIWRRRGSRGRIAETSPRVVSVSCNRTLIADAGSTRW